MSFDVAQPRPGRRRQNALCLSAVKVRVRRAGWRQWRRGGGLPRRQSADNTLNYFQRHRSFKAAPGSWPRQGSDRADGHETVSAARHPATRHGRRNGDPSNLTAAARRAGRPVIMRLATPTNQAPRMATNGEPEERTLLLELFVADVARRQPSAGKSTFWRPRQPPDPRSPTIRSRRCSRISASSISVHDDLCWPTSRSDRAGPGPTGHGSTSHQRTRVLIHLATAQRPIHSAIIAPSTPSCPLSATGWTPSRKSSA
jgi:hypothetical protein